MKHINLKFRSDAHGRHGSINAMSLCNVSRFKHEDDTKTTRTRHELGLYLHRYVATLLVLLMAGIGQAWGETLAISVSNPTTTTYTENGVTIKGVNVANKTFNNVSNSKVFKINSNLSSGGGDTLGIRSTSSNIKKIVISACAASSGTYPCINIGTSSNGSTYTIITSGISVEGGATGTSTTSGENIYLVTYASKSDVTVTFTTPQRYVKLYRSAASNNKESSINSISVYTEDAARTFKSGDKIYFKDKHSSALSSTWKTAGGYLYAYFFNATEENWSDKGTLVAGTENNADAVYQFTVPGSGKTYTTVIFTRGTAATFVSGDGFWNKVADQTPAVGKNLFTVSTSTYDGEWGQYGYPAALVGSFNNWDPSANVFPNSGISSVNIDDLEASTSYQFKVLQGESFCGVGSGTITETTTDWWHLDGAYNVYMTTGTTGRYTFSWNTSTYYLGVYYPGGTLTKNKYIYFDARTETDWVKAGFAAQFVFKFVDSGSEQSTKWCEKGDAVQDWVYYTTVPDNDFVGQVKMDRYSAKNGTWWNRSAVTYAYSRDNINQNCMVTPSSGGDDIALTWGTYCPPISTSTLSDNSTSVISWSSGDGTSGDPFLVPADGTIKVSASATKAVPDPDMTINYDFKVDGSSAQSGTGSTFDKGSLSNNTTYTISLDTWNSFNSTTGTKNTSATALYYKALTMYSVTHTLSNVTKSTGHSDAGAAAYYQPYTATYTAAEGYDLPESVTVKFGETTKTVTTDYTWSVSDETGTLSIPANKIDGNVTIIINGDAQEYAITYKDQGGEAYSGSNSASLPDTHTYGVATDLVDGVKSGYEFKGWYTDESCTVSAGSSIGATSKTAAFTLYAKWAVLYTVAYNANGGSCKSSDEQASSGASITLATPTWSGYTMEGWYDSSGTKIANAGGSYTPSGNIVLYAYWTDDISGKVFSFIDGNYGAKFKAFDLSGYVSSNATGKDKTYKNATTNVQFVIDDGAWDNKSNAIAALAKLVKGTTSMSVVVPTDTLATVKISYGAYADDKGNKYGPLTVGGSNQTAVSTALTNGMTNAQVIGAMKEITLNNQTGTLTLGSSSGNIFIGCVSAVISGYKVHYNQGANGTGEAIADDTKTHGSNLTLSSSTYTREGYTQDGWSTSDGGSKVYELGGTYSANAAITLYPHWAGDTYNVDFDLTNVTYSSGNEEGTDAATHGTDFEVTFAAASRYDLPDEITVTIDGSEVSEGTKYTWDESTGELSISGEYITGNIVVTIEGIEGAIPALITYNLQAPNSSTQPSSLDTTSVATTPATLKGDTLKNFTNMVLGSSFSITGKGKDDKGNWTAKIGKTPADSTTTDANSVKLSFDVHDDYELSVTSVSLRVKAVSSGTRIFRACLSDGTSSVYGRVAPGEDSDDPVVFGSFSGVKFSGKVTLTLWVWGSSNKEFRLKTPIQINGSLSKKPAPSNYTVTYANGDADEGTVPVDANSPYEAGATVTVLDNTGWLFKSGYEFGGWSDGVNTYAADATFTMPSSNVTLTAVWTSCTKPGTPTRPTIEDGTLTHAGATFVWDPLGATANSDGYMVSIVKVSDGSTVLDWTSTDIYAVGGPGGLYDATGLTELTEYYFNVRAKGADGYCSYGDTSRLTFTTLGTPYTITYHLNGASWINEGAATYRYGTGYTLPVAGDMSNTGYTFGGWYANSDLSTGGVVTKIADDATGNKEFWAKWTENTYTITYNANGGSGTTSATEGHYVTVANNGFTAPSGKIFVGWNTLSGGGGDSYGEGDEIELTANMTLYAIWASDYDISWGNAQYGGADEIPNLGGGNYTITASVATWTGTLTTDMISAVSDGVTITNVAVDNSASPKTITATFDVGASVAGTTIKMQLDVPAYGVYGAKSSEKSITIDRCSGGESSTVVFSQNFSSVGAGSVDYAANTAREYKSGGTTITGIVGSGTNEFTYIGQAQKGNCGVAVNSSTGGNSVNATGMFQAYCNNTGGKYALVKNSDFAATAPTALKVSMKIWFQQGSSGSDYSVTFAVGDGFSNSTSAPDATNVHSGFSIINNSNAYLYAYKSNKTALSGTNKLTQGSDLTMVWVINNSGQTLSYTDPASNTSTLANDKFDVWIGTTRFIAGANATTASKALQELYIGDPAGKNHQLRLDDIVVTDISPAVSSITPTLTWDDGDLDIASDDVTKEEGDADFTYIALQNKNSLGAITYSSSSTSVATVNETTGKVHIVGNGSTTITATIAESGCYEDADVSYELTVNEKACADAAGTIKNNDGSTITDNAITKSSCETVTLKLVGYADGATIQWYKDGVAIVGAVEETYIVGTSDAGVFSAISSSTCDRNSTNEITVTNSASVSATKIVDSWYVKAGRRTPDIALVQTTDAASFQVKISSTVIWSTVSGSEVTTGLGGCGFYLGKDGIIYLKGTKNNGNATDDLEENKTLSFVVTNACGTNASDPGNITIKRQASTSRPSVAYVSVGTANGAVTDTTAGYYKTTALYKYLDNTLGSGDFDLTAQNAYWSVSEKELKEHYSQFDAILITDDPSTDKKNKKGGTSFIDAIGSLVDVRPILTMEAYVSKLSNWKAKGIDGNPSSPNPRQYGMTLQCKDHEIFGDLDVGDNVKEKTIDGTTYWTVLMVDSTKSPYSGVAYNSETKEKPALQGFAASDVSGLLLLGEISNGTLYAGVERQEEPAARLMVLGINAKALPNALTNEGKIIIKNSLGYLLKTNMEEVDDCSNYFTGKTSSDWNTESNWSKGVVPNSPMIRARILAPCEITGITVKAAQIDIVTSGTSSKKAGELTGKLTINPTGALIVGGKIRAAEAPYFSIEDLKPTEETDLVINTCDTAQAALIFNNDAGDTKATVNLYSLGRKVSGTYQFQYMAVPMDYVSVSESFAGSGIYTYVWNEASGWERRGYYTDLFAFEGVGITTKFGEAKDYRMKGTLASTETKEIALTNDADGINMIGNSWTAPIQISKLEEDNSATEINQTVYIYCTGNGNTVIDGPTETPGQWLAIPFNAADFELWTGLKVIPAMQAFDIKVSGTSTLTLDYDKLVRGGTTDMNAKLRAPKRNVAHEGIDLTRIRVADSKTHTDLYLFEGDQFSDEFDNGWEAEFMSGDGRSAQLYAQTELGKMAVIALPDIEGTVLGFVPGQESVYTFHFTGANNGYYLNDLKLLQSTPIDETSTYTFTYEEGDTNRFIISSTPINKIVTGNENVGAEAAKVRKLILNDKVYIIRSGRMYSVDGQMVK